MKKLNKIITVMILCFISYGSILADETSEKFAKIDSLLGIITVYEFGMDRSALTEFAGIVTDELNNTVKRNMLENRMTDFLLSKATLDGKQFMCEQLSIAAPERAVLVLLILLKKPETSDMARYTLDRIPGITSDVALRDAAENNKHDIIKIGSINSLGYRKDTTSVKILIEFLSSPNQDIAAASATSLGMIGNDKATKMIAEQLPNYEGKVRDLLADSYLKCADNMLAAGDRKGAEKIYSEILQSEKNDFVRMAALNGLLGVMENPVELIVSTLEGDDDNLIEIAAKNIRILEKNDDIVKVAELLSDVNLDVKVKILGAFDDMQNPVTHKYVVAAVNDDDEFVSSAALNVLRKIGTKDDVALFVNIAVNGKGKNKEVAQTNLDLFNADGVDDEIISLLKSESDNVKVELIRTVSARQINSAYDAVYVAATSENKKLKAEAIKTLGSVAEPDQLQDLLVLLENAESDGERKRVESAVVAVVGKIPDKDERAEPLIKHLSRTKNEGVAHSLLRILSSTGSPEAYKILQTALNGDDEAAQKIVIQSLSNWPGDEPIKDMMKFAKSTSNETYKILALRSYITLVKRSDTLTDDEKIKNYKEALSQSEADNEKRMILSGITEVRTLKSFQLANELLADENIQREAFIAVLQIAEDIVYDHPEEVKKVLEQILKNTDNEDVRGWSQEILNGIK